MGCDGSCSSIKGTEPARAPWSRGVFHSLLASWEEGFWLVYSSLLFLFLVQVWRKHLEAYSRCSLELEESLEASALQMSTLNL